jgi:plastocyanin
MTLKAIPRAFIATVRTAVLIMLGLASDLEAAPADPRSMLSIMRLDHASDLRAMPAADANTAEDANTISIKDFHFSPMSLAVPAGTMVTWKNLDGEPHTVVSIEGVFRSGGLDQDDSFTFKFDKPGTYKFVCSIHPQMLGTIVVK